MSNKRKIFAFILSVICTFTPIYTANASTVFSKSWWVEKFKIKPLAEKLLDKYGENLVLKQSKCECPQVNTSISEDEMEYLLSCLIRNESPCIIGKTDVRKSVIEILSWRIAHGQVPKDLKGVQIIKINLPALIADSKDDRALENKLRAILEYSAKQRNIVIFIDNFRFIKGKRDLFAVFLDRRYSNLIAGSSLEEFGARDTSGDSRPIQDRFSPVFYID